MTKEKEIDLFKEGIEYTRYALLVEMGIDTSHLQIEKTIKYLNEFILYHLIEGNKIKAKNICKISINEWGAKSKGGKYGQHKLEGKGYPKVNLSESFRKPIREGNIEVTAREYLVLPEEIRKKILKDTSKYK